MDRLTVTEAAEALGVTQDAVYKRIQRGSIGHTKDSQGRVYVYLDTSDIEPDKSTDASTDTSERDELLTELRAHNEHLRRQLEVWQEEARRKDYIISALTERIPELEPAPETRESPVVASEEQGKGDDVPPQDKRSWWRRIFGGDSPAS